MSLLQPKEITRFKELANLAKENIILGKKVSDIEYINKLLEWNPGYSKMWGLFKKEPLSYDDAAKTVITNFSNRFVIAEEPHKTRDELLEKLNNITSVFEHYQDGDEVYFSGEDLNFLNYWATIEYDYSIDELIIYEMILEKIEGENNE